MPKYNVVCKIQTQTRRYDFEAKDYQDLLNAIDDLSGVEVIEISEYLDIPKTPVRKDDGNYRKYVKFEVLNSQGAKTKVKVPKVKKSLDEKAFFTLVSSHLEHKNSPVRLLNSEVSF